ncbi:MAG: DUF1553 domain-containing protein, partial [Acidobacteria bacterium]|nr:DUF1553 domain-containing protein [Acidobacteriota bacterium]
ANSEYRLLAGKLASLSHVFPAGGRRGSTVEISLAGVNLDQVEAISLDGVPGAAEILAKTPERLEARLKIPSGLEPGAYRLRARSAGASLPNALTFQVSDLPEVVLSGSPSAVLLDLKQPAVHNGVIREPKQAHNYWVEAGAGEQITVSAEAMRLGNFLDPAITIFDASGNVIAYMDETAPNGFDKEPPSVDPHLVHTFGKAGRYRIEMRDAALRGRESFVYRLLIGRSEPGFEVYTLTNQVTVAAGQKALLTVRVRRRGGLEHAGQSMGGRPAPPGRVAERRGPTGEHPFPRDIRGGFFLRRNECRHSAAGAHGGAAGLAAAQDPGQRRDERKKARADGSGLLPLAADRVPAGPLRGRDGPDGGRASGFAARSFPHPSNAMRLTTIALLGFVSVALAAEGRPVSFRRDVAPILTARGCTGSNCHGSVRGKAGFKLSLFGAQPENDYEAVVKSDGGRRVDRGNPPRSLLLRKPTFQEAHGGGQRFAIRSRDYETLVAWIRDGCIYDAGGPELLEIEVRPGEILSRAGGRQPLTVTGLYSDRSRADLTAAVRYSSNDETLAAVSDSGEVTAKRVGETAIMVRTQGITAVARVLVISPTPPVREHGPGHRASEAAARSFIDRLVFSKLRKINVAPSPPAPDPVFLRRAYLDTIGTLPTIAEAPRFLDSRDPGKRERLIDELLARPEFVDLWAMKLADVYQLGGTGVKGGWQLHRWLRQSLRENKPYDRLVRELLLGAGAFVYDAPVNYYYGLMLGPEGMVTQVAQSLLGIRMDCAKCHDHPFERWTQNDYYGLAGFFTRLQRKAEPYGLFENAVSIRPDSKATYDYLNNGKELLHPKTKLPVEARYLGGEAVTAPPGVDLRERLADWITSPGNPWFSRATANRVWKHYLGRGVVEPVDDFRVSNPPSNQALLDALAAHLVESQYDLKALARAILNSRTYQLSSAPKGSNAGDEINYSRYYPKRQIAEVMFDSMAQAAESRPKIAGYPPGSRAIEVALGSPNYFLSAFGKTSAREQICERNHEPDVAQAMHLQNGDTVNSLLQARGNILERLLARADLTPAARLEEIYLAALSRRPAPEESAEVERRLAAAGDDSARRGVYEDLLWALLNSKEFAYIY